MKDALKGILWLFLVLVFSKEIIFLNEEIIVIFCFLLFLFYGFFYGGEILVGMLDLQAQDLLLKIVALFTLQLDVLYAARSHYVRLVSLTSKVKKVIAYTVVNYAQYDGVFLKLARRSILRKILSRTFSLVMQDLDMQFYIYQHIIRRSLKLTRK